jgi:nuclear transport factor 2 (NTF2) superfamily protein
MNKRLVKILVGIIIVLIFVILSLVWLFVLNPKTEKKETTSEFLEKEILEYFNDYGDVYAAKLIVDYYKRNEDTTINEVDYEAALKRYKYYYGQYSKKMDLLFKFVKDNNVIKTKEDMADMFDILQDIVVLEEDVIYVFAEKDRKDLIKAHELINQMNTSKNQKALDEFKEFYLSKDLDAYESYVIFLRVIYCMPDLLGDTIVTYNNKEIEFSVFLKDSGILDKYLSSVNNFYEKFESE